MKPENIDMLSQQQRQFYHDNGYLVLEGIIPAPAIVQCQSEIERFLDEARNLTESNDRIDLEDSHTREDPRLRRIKDPFNNSPVFSEIIRSELILEPVRDLLGPNLRLHGSKLNLKSASFGAPVEWHQDWAFYPHTNDDMLAVGVMLNDMNEENGPLMILPGTHKSEIYDHHSEGFFCGAMDLRESGLDSADAVKLLGPAGSISLHHARVVHGSDLNRSETDRKLLLFEIAAADAFPIQGSTTHFGSIEDYDTKMLCGEMTVTPRLENVPVRLPQPRKSAGSIYEFQKAARSRTFREYEPTRDAST